MVYLGNCIESSVAPLLETLESDKIFNPDMQKLLRSIYPALDSLFRNNNK